MWARGLFKKKKKKRVGQEKEGVLVESFLVAELTPAFQHPSCAEGSKPAHDILSLFSGCVSFGDDWISADLNQPGPSLDLA